MTDALPRIVSHTGTDLESDGVGGTRTHNAGFTPYPFPQDLFFKLIDVSLCLHSHTPTLTHTLTNTHTPHRARAHTHTHTLRLAPVPCTVCTHDHTSRCGGRVAAA